MAAITAETVRHVALLSRLELDEDQVRHFTQDLQNIVGYVEKLAGLDVSHIAPTSHSLQIENVFRDDVMRPSLAVTDSLANAPDAEDECFKVSAVIQDPS